MKNILIIGATSAMAEHTARIYAQRGDALYLLARDENKLAAITQDLTVRGAAQVHTANFDANDLATHAAIITQVFDTLKTIDVCLIAHGSLPDQQQCQQSAELTLAQLNINGLSVINLLTHISNKMEVQGHGNITVITSVAGDRGRQSNYVYGAAKAMVSTFLQGLSQRLAKANVHVLDIKPGFVDTPMTSEFKKGALWAKPQDIAQLIVSRIDKNSHFSYAPSFWWLIMTIITSIPKFIFNKLKL